MRWSFLYVDVVGEKCEEGGSLLKLKKKKCFIVEINGGNCWDMIICKCKMLCRIRIRHK